jgi:hypothetical protein
VFNSEMSRDDLMMFGEHLGSPPGFQEYVDAGMRLVDSQLKGELNYRFGNPSASLAGLDTPGFSGNVAFNQFTGVPFAKSHDDDYVSRSELHYGYYLTKAALPNIYTDGNYQSETLAQSGGAFPRHANTAFLGQFSDYRIPNLVYIHNHFARGDQYSLWSDGDYVAYQRVDKRENGGTTDADGAVLLFMLNDNYAAGASRSIATSQLKFGHTPFVDDAYLYNYSTYGGGFYVYASQLGSVIVPGAATSPSRGAPPRSPTCGRGWAASRSPSWRTARPPAGSATSARTAPTAIPTSTPTEWPATAPTTFATPGTCRA